MWIFFPIKMWLKYNIWKRLTILCHPLWNYYERNIVIHKKNIIPRRIMKFINKMYSFNKLVCYRKVMWIFYPINNVVLIMKFGKVNFIRQPLPFSLILHLVGSVLHINISQIYPDVLVDMNMKLLSSIIINKCCVNLMASGDIDDSLVRSLHREYSITFLTEETNSICKWNIIIVDDEKDIKDMLLLDNLGIKVIILMTEVDFPGKNLESMLHGSDDVFLLSFVTNSAYTLNSRGQLVKVMDTSNISSVSHRSLLELKEKFLIVSTFNCPIFSYGTEGELNSSSSNLSKYGFRYF